MSQLALINCGSYEQNAVDEALQTALSYFGGMKTFVKPGQKVLLKVSLLKGAAPEKAITTHPAIVKSVVKEVQRSGGLAFIGDLPGNVLIDMARAFKISGFSQVAEETGAQLTTLKKSGVHFAKLNNRCLKELALSTEVLEYDLIISLPKLKTHMLTLLTGAIKNMYGTVFGYHKSQYHLGAPRPDQFAEILVDVFEIVRPGLTIMDAVVAMEGNGPSEGSPKFMGALIASPDAVACDSVAAYLMGFDPDEILTTKIAEKKKLGVAALSKIKIHGEAPEKLKVPDFIRPKNVYNILKFIPRTFFGFLKILGNFIKVEPRLRPELCSRCNVCVKHCPVQAIKEEEGDFPKINQRLCIHCFCCLEVCPEEAIKARPSWLLKILSARNSQS